MKERILNLISKNMTYEDVLELFNYYLTCSNYDEKNLLNKFKEEKIIDATNNYDSITYCLSVCTENSEYYFEELKANFLQSINCGELDLLCIGKNILFIRKKYETLRDTLILYPLCINKKEEIIPKIKFLFTI